MAYIETDEFGVPIVRVIRVVSMQPPLPARSIN